jgi:hypothetical protein
LTSRAKAFVYFANIIHNNNNNNDSESESKIIFIVFYLDDNNNENENENDMNLRPKLNRICQLMDIQTCINDNYTNNNIDNSSNHKNKNNNSADLLLRNSHPTKGVTSRLRLAAKRPNSCWSKHEGTKRKLA